MERIFNEGLNMRLPERNKPKEIQPLTWYIIKAQSVKRGMQNAS